MLTSSIYFCCERQLIIISFFLYTEIIPNMHLLNLSDATCTQQTATLFAALDGALETPGEGKSSSRLQMRQHLTPVRELRPRSIRIKLSGTAASTRWHL